MPLGEYRETRRGLILNRTHQMLVCTDDMNLLGGNIYTIKKNKETIIDANKDFALEVNTKKTISCLIISMQGKIVT
jgi:hypothetical protein